MKNICLKRRFNYLFLLILTLFLVFAPFYEAKAATVKLSKTAVQLTPKQSYTLKITGTKKKAKWSSSNAKVASVSSKGKVKAKKSGTAVISAKIGSKKYSCRVLVAAKTRKISLNKNNQVFLGKLVKETWRHPWMGKQTAYIMKLMKPVKFKNNEGKVVTVSEIQVFPRSTPSRYLNKYVFVKGSTVSQVTQYYRRALALTQARIG